MKNYLGPLNYHGSYLDILPILDIDDSSDIYFYIVTLSKFLHKKSNDLALDLLNLIVLKTYFPGVIPFSLDNFEFLKEYFGEALSDSDLVSIKKKIEQLDPFIKDQKELEFYQIMLKERKFEQE